MKVGLVRYPDSWGCTYHTHRDCPGLNGGTGASELPWVPVGPRRKCQHCTARDRLDQGELTMEHTCRKSGQPLSRDEYQHSPAWASPGEIVKLMDEQRWGRIAIVWRCCATYDVMAVTQDDEPEVALLHLPLSGLENAWTPYPANLPPKGYPIPRVWPLKGTVGFGGRVAYRIAPNHGG